MNYKIVLLSAVIIVSLFLRLISSFGEERNNNFAKDSSDYVLNYSDNGDIICTLGIMHVKYPDIVFEQLVDVFSRKLELFNRSNKITGYAVGEGYINTGFMKVDSILFNADIDPLYSELTEYLITSDIETDEYFILSSDEMKNPPKALPLLYEVDTTESNSIKYYLHNINEIASDTLVFSKSNNSYQIIHNHYTLLSIKSNSYFYNFSIDYLFDYDNDNKIDWIGTLSTTNGDYYILYKSSQPNKVALSYERLCDHKCMHDIKI
ncbi:MAG: hypothetical protein HUU54_05660 [Ignavibacteriaceae bacterium]|nr:hypothetical protein [Ignavibacteriaceae bacterium]